MFAEQPISLGDFDLVTSPYLHMPPEARERAIERLTAVSRSRRTAAAGNRWPQAGSAMDAIVGSDLRRVAERMRQRDIAEVAVGGTPEAATSARARTAAQR